jgi:hypothetical protein
VESGSVVSTVLPGVYFWALFRVNVVGVFIQRKKMQLRFFIQRKECSCGFSSKERNVFMTIAFSRAL